MTEWDEIVIAIDNLSTKKTTTIATNTTSAGSKNCQSKKKMRFYIYFTYSLLASYYY